MTVAPAARPVTPVAVGVLLRADGAALLADRPAGKPYAGYWEFPGGKVEAGESVAQALERELQEELGIRIAGSEPWVVTEYDYPHAFVRLYFRRVYAWDGVPHPVEGQRLCFVAAGATTPAPLLPAAVPGLRWLQLPALSSSSAQDATDAGQAIAWMQQALARGLRQIVWHEPGLRGRQCEQAYQRCFALTQAHGARLLVDARTQAHCPALAGDGVYLDLETLRAARRRPAAQWLGAAVRNDDDLRRAAALGCDFAILEDADPARPFDSAGAALAAQTPLPLYLSRVANAPIFNAARAAGFHGLAVPAPH